MKLHQALNQLRERLPIYRESNESYKETLIKEFSFYNSAYKNIDESDLLYLFQSDKSSIIQKLTKQRFSNCIEIIQKNIVDILDKYHEGYPGEAYSILYALMAKNKSIDRYIDDIYSNYFKLDLETGHEFQNFFRMRASKTPIDEKKELFHVPFEDRELVSTARFSIPGFPCLYLGTSLDVCWLERGLSKGSDEEIYACRYTNHKPLSFVNLSIPHSFDSEDIKNNPFDAFRFLITYPFYSACLVRVLFQNKPFKPEYIVPQLLLQYIKNEDLLDGIIYSSTKDKTLITNKYLNIVIPSRKIKDNGHCEMMKRWYYLTDIVKVDVSKIKESEESLLTMHASKLM